MAVERFQFEGFSAPGYTQVPDEFFDVCLRYLSGAETKVMCYLFRRTFGWKKESDAVSLSQLTGGIVRRDGTRLDGGAGVTRETAANALKSLEQKGLLVREPQIRPDGGTGTTVYRIRFRGGSVEPTPPVGKADSPGPEKPARRVGKGDSGLVGQADPQDPGVPTDINHQIADTWQKATIELIGRFSRANYKTYIQPLQLVSLKGSQAVIQAPNAFVGDCVRGRFGTTIAAALSAVAGRPVSINVRVDG